MLNLLRRRSAAAPPITILPLQALVRLPAGSTLLICLAMLLIGLPTLIEPFGRDQAEYAVIAEAMLRGQVVYRDVFNVKPPLTHLLHAAALALFGPSMLSIRLLDLLWQTATALLIALIARHVSGKRAVGVAAAIVYGLSYFSAASYWHRAQTDGFITLFVAAAILALYHTFDRLRPAYLLAAGLAVGLAVLLKYPIGILAPLIGLLLIVRFRWRGLGAALLLALGTALPILVAALLLWAEGGIAEFLWTQFTYIPLYSGQSAGWYLYLRKMLWGVSAVLTLTPAGLVTVVALVLFAIRLRQPGGQAFLPLLIWTLAALVHLGVQNKFYPYHRLPLLGVNAIAVALLVVPTLQATLARPVRVASTAVLAGFTLSYLGLIAAPQYATLFAVATARKTVEQAQSQPQFAESGDFSSAVNLRVAHTVAARSAPGDTIFIWGFEPSIYFLSERLPATRFIYNFPLYGRFPSPELRAQLLAQLDNAEPRYILVVKNDAIPHVTGVLKDSAAALVTFPELRAFIGRYYEQDAVIEDFTLYRRVGPVVTAKRS